MPNTLTRQELEDRLDGMVPGEKLRYHTGSLMHDRVRGFDFGKVNNVAHAAFVAYEAGKVHLTQRYLAPLTYDYFIVKKPAPFKAVEWTGCYDPHRNSIKRLAPASA